MFVLIWTPILVYRILTPTESGVVFELPEFDPHPALRATPILVGEGRRKRRLRVEFSYHLQPCQTIHLFK